MEAFSLLKYWRASAGGGGGGGANGDLAPLNNTPKPVNAVDSSTTTTPTTQNDTSNTTSPNDDDGPFFDLEFSLDDDDDDDDELEDIENDSDIDIDDDDDDGSKSTTKSVSENDNEEEREFSLVPIESPNDSDQPSSNNAKAQFPVSSLIKSATRFRVFMSGFNKRTSSKPNTNANDNGESVTTSSVNSTNSSSKKLFTVKFKVEEVPIVSLFTRDSSARGSGRVKQVQQGGGEGGGSEAAAAEEKRFSKEAVQRYLRKVRPLYVRVSRRSGVDAGAKPKVVVEAAEEAAAAVVKAGGMNLPAGLRVVCKHLGKSRSASSMVVAAPVPAGNAAAMAAAGGRRRDDSLIQQQDGIQSAILHCKRSFNSPRDSEACLLPRCTSDPSNNEKKGLDLSRKSADAIQRP